MPKIEDFSNKIDEFQISNENVRECIVNFDKSLCLKADKDGFRTFQKHLEGLFISKDLQEHIENQLSMNSHSFHEEYQKRTDDFENLKKKLTEHLHIHMMDEFLAKFEKYDKIEKEFTKFFDQQHLSVALNNKADLEMFNQMTEQKASKVELSAVRGLVDNLNDRIKQISTL